MDWSDFGYSNDVEFDVEPASSRTSCGPYCWLRKGLHEPDSHPLLKDPEVPLTYNRSEVERRLYSPLASWQTRLIQLEPGNFGDPLKCELLTAEIIYFDGLGIGNKRQVVQYEAISYSWGRPDLTYPIFCGGRELTIPPPLAAALRSLRHKDKSRYLWVDAVCINQNDKEEKAAQIGIMYAIFHKALRVVAWLGEKISGIETAFRLLSLSAEPQRQEHSDECRVQAARADAALQELLQRPWFRRTWIRLEVFAGQNTVLRCGAHEVDFHNLVSLGPQRIANSFGLKKSRESHEFAIETWLVAEEAGGEEVETVLQILNRGPSEGLTVSEVLLNTLEEGRFFQTSEPRDYVYAIRGLISNIEKDNKVARRLDLEDIKFENLRHIVAAIQNFPIKSSDEATVSGVFQDVIKFAINEDRDLQVLWRYEIQHNRASDIPGWAIDWRKTWEQSLIYSRALIDHERYLAAREDLRIKPPKITRWKQPGEPPLQDLGQSGFLRLKGSLLGKVTGIENVSLQWLESEGGWLARDLAVDQQKIPKLLDLLSYHVRVSVKYESAIQAALIDGTTFFNSEQEVAYMSGDEGLVQQSCRPSVSTGDVLAFLWGSKHPFLLKHTKDSRFSFLGVFNMRDHTKFERTWQKLGEEEFVLE